MATKRIIIGALSGLQYHDRRQRCRATWMQDARRCAGLDAVFLIGALGIVSRPTRIDDLLLLPCPDGYAYLPQRTRWFCRWALENGEFEYLFKCDDDTYVAIDRLAAFPTGARPYIGKDIGGYASGGGGYFLDRTVAELVAACLEQQEGAEDLLVGQVAKQAHIPLSNDNRFTAFAAAWFAQPE